MCGNLWDKEKEKGGGNFDTDVFFVEKSFLKFDKACENYDVEVFEPKIVGSFYDM